ncbi:hypothetical protein ACFQGT_08785 [Natrialbaceae archaeon GCM10025810]|uniref:hypothetical protein n=1 Tax=Halovalidus salilacus TaxID=3075124 RepID=UPI003623820B
MASQSTGWTLVLVGTAIIVVPFVASVLLALGPAWGLGTDGTFVATGIAFSLRESSESDGDGGPNRLRLLRGADRRRG